MVSTNITFKIEFNLGNDPKDLTFTDLIASAYSSTYGYTLSNIKGIIKITAPSGIIVYQNAGWATDSFAASDIIGSTTTWSKSSIQLPLDSDDEVETGTYTFEYKVSTDGGTSVGFTVSKTYDYQYVSPVVDIDLSANLRTSQLTSIDSTNYAVVISGTTYEAGTVTRSHTITAPSDAGCTIPTTATTSESTRTIGGGGTATTDIWTGVWQTNIETDLVFNLATWNSENWFIVNDTVTGTENLEITNSNFTSVMSTYITTYTNRYIGYLTTNRSLANSMKSNVTTLLTYWMQFQQAERFGNDTTTILNNIQIILGTEITLSTTDAASERIVAWGNSTSGGSAASTFQFTNSTSTPTGGNAGDYHIKTDTWILYYNSAGTWVSLGSIQGATGATGAAGSNGADGTVVLSNSVSDSGTPAGTSETDLKSYTLPGDQLASTGDVAYIKALCEVGLNENRKTIKLYYGGDVIAEFETASLAYAIDKHIKLEMWITRTGASAQFIEYSVTRSGNPGTIYGSFSTTKTKTNASDQIIKVTGTNGVATADDIVCKQLIVEYKSI